MYLYPNFSSRLADREGFFRKGFDRSVPRPPLSIGSFNKKCIKGLIRGDLTISCKSHTHIFSRAYLIKTCASIFLKLQIFFFQDQNSSSYVLWACSHDWILIVFATSRCTECSPIQSPALSVPKNVTIIFGGAAEFIFIMESEKLRKLFS